MSHDGRCTHKRQSACQSNSSICCACDPSYWNLADYCEPCRATAAGLSPRVPVVRRRGRNRTTREARQEHVQSYLEDRTWADLESAEEPPSHPLAVPAPVRPRTWADLVSADVAGRGAPALSRSARRSLRPAPPAEQEQVQEPRRPITFRELLRTGAAEVASSRRPGYDGPSPWEDSSWEDSTPDQAHVPSPPRPGSWATMLAPVAAPVAAQPPSRSPIPDSPSSSRSTDDPLALSPPPPPPASVNQLAEDASVLLELFSQSSPDNEDDIEQEHLDLIASAAAGIVAIQARVRQNAARRNIDVGVLERPAFDTGADGNCIICYTEIADRLFLPCKHLVVCTACCDKMGIRERNMGAPALVRCPVCRSGVAETGGLDQGIHELSRQRGSVGNR